MTVDRIGEPIRRFRLEVLHGPFRLAADLTQPGDLLFGDALTRVFADWDRQVGNETITATIVEQYTVHLRGLQRYAAAEGYTHLDQIDSSLLRRWISSALQDGGQPSISTTRNRLQAASGMFMTAILLGIHDLNPAHAISMPLSKTRYVHPFTEDQIRALKRVADWRLEIKTPKRPESKAGAALALMMLGATTTEAANVTAPNVRLADGLVWVHGGGQRTRERWLPIDDQWCMNKLADRALLVMHDRHFGDRRPLCYDGTGSGNSAVTTMLTQLMQKARVYEAGVTRAESLRDYVAARVFAETGRVEEVAARLGLFSLDIAAHIVGYDWLTATKLAEPPSQSWT